MGWFRIGIMKYTLQFKWIGVSIYPMSNIHIIPPLISRTSPLTNLIHPNSMKNHGQTPWRKRSSTLINHVCSTKLSMILCIPASPIWGQDSSHIHIAQGSSPLVPLYHNLEPGAFPYLSIQGPRCEGIHDKTRDIKCGRAHIKQLILKPMFSTTYILAS